MSKAHQAPAAAAPARASRPGSDVGARRRLILREAAKSLNVRGVTSTSLADIARQSGVTRAALYYYFEDQEDLVFQCYRQSCERMAARLSEARAEGGGAGAVLGRFFDRMTDPAEDETATLCEVAYLSDNRRHIVVGLYEGVIASLAGLLRHGAEAGAFRTCDERIAAMAILGLISWIPLQRRWATSAPFTAEDLAGAAKRLILEGAAADGPTVLDYQPLALTPRDVPQRDVFDRAAVSSAKQEMLLAAASWLFTLKGVDATSLDEIAARVGVTKKVIYHNIGGKEALLTACNLRALAFAIALMQRTNTEEVLDIGVLGRLMHAHVEAKLREDIAPLSGVGGLEFLPQAARHEIDRQGARLLAEAETVYGRARALGVLRDVELGPFLTILPGVIEWVPKWLGAETAAERDHIGRQLAAFCTFGLRMVRPA